MDNACMLKGPVHTTHGARNLLRREHTVLVDPIRSPVRGMTVLTRNLVAVASRKVINTCGAIVAILRSRVIPSSATLSFPQTLYIRNRKGLPSLFEKPLPRSWNSTVLAVLGIGNNASVPKRLAVPETRGETISMMTRARRINIWFKTEMGENPLAVQTSRCSHRHRPTCM